MKTEGMVPNSTQVPNIVLDEWMPKLSDVELRVLLIVIRQTLGWEEDSETGRRKEYDWISRSQLMMKAGRSAKHISKAIKSLIETHHVVEAVDSKGRKLDTAGKRSQKFGKIFYRYTWKAPDLTLFDKPLRQAMKSERTKGHTEGDQETKSPTQKGHTTKETQLTKENTLQPEAARLLIQEPKRAGKSTHAKFIEFFHTMVQRTRGIKPFISKADAGNLKRILTAGVDEGVLEQIALYFLADHSFRTFSPSISTLCSAGILNGLLNRTKNDPEFHKRLDEYADRYIPRTFEADARKYEVVDMQKALQALGARFTVGHS